MRRITQAFLLAAIFPSFSAYCQDSVDVGANIGAQFDRFTIKVEHAPSSQSMKVKFKDMQLGTIGAYVGYNFAEDFFLRYDLTYGFGLKKPKVSSGSTTADFGLPLTYTSVAAKARIKCKEQQLWKNRFQFGWRYALSETSHFVPRIGVEISHRRLGKINYSRTSNVKTSVKLHSCSPFIGLGLQCQHGSDLSLGLSVDYMYETARFRRAEVYGIFLSRQPSSLKTRSHAVQVEANANWKISEQWNADFSCSFKAARGKKNNEVEWRNISTPRTFAKYSSRTKTISRTIGFTAGMTYLF